MLSHLSLRTIWFSLHSINGGTRLVTVMLCNNIILSPQVTDALARAGLESSNLIVGIDFTKSNEWTGWASLWCIGVLFCKFLKKHA